MQLSVLLILVKKDIYNVLKNELGFLSAPIPLEIECGWYCFLSVNDERLSNDSNNSVKISSGKKL